MIQSIIRFQPVVTNIFGSNFENLNHHKTELRDERSGYAVSEYSNYFSASLNFQVWPRKLAVSFVWVIDSYDISRTLKSEFSRATLLTNLHLTINSTLIQSK